MKITHKNKIFEGIRNCSLSLENFTIETSNTVVDLTHKTTDFTFKFIQDPTSFDYFFARATHYEPAFPVKQFMSITDVNTVIKGFYSWLLDHLEPYIADQQEVDLLANYLHGANLLNVEPVNYEDTDNFTPEQKQQIRIGFNDLKLLITRDYATSNEQLQIVNQRLEYLSGALDRMNKTDWKGIFISTVIGIITTLTLDTAKGNDLFNAFITILHMAPTLFGHLNT
jgi:hypothetical protein